MNVAGFGFALALHLDRLGATVFAGCLNADGPGAMELKEKGSDHLHVLQMDVTSDKQVAECVLYVMRTTSGSGIQLGFICYILIVVLLVVVYCIFAFSDRTTVT